MAPPAPSQPAPARKKKAPPPLSNAYQKAHKTYVLSAALLASWQLIGIELNTKEKWGVELKSPHAVPLILLAMIVYFGYRLTVEWMQCDEERRSHRAANVDFVVAHTIAGLALVISFIQYLFRIRIADTIARINPELRIFFLVTSFLFSTIYTMWNDRQSHSRLDRKIAIYGSIAMPILWIAMLALVLQRVNWSWTLLTGTSAILSSFLLAILFRTLPRLMAKRRLAKIVAKQQTAN